MSDSGPVTLTFDSSPRDGSAGVLLGFVGGPEARELAAMPASQRRAPVLACLERLFGPRAARPLDYAEQTWTEEEWSGGGPTSNFGPGGWTACGALRQPVGRVHWAGTETATVWSGYMEGALEAGERVAAGGCWKAAAAWVRVGLTPVSSSPERSPRMAYEMKIRGTEDEVKVRSPWAAALLPIITLGIYHLVWWYRINRELRDYGKAKGYDLGQNPTNSVLALFPGGIIIVPALITYWRGTKRVMGASSLAGKEPLNGWIAIILYLLLCARALGLHPGLAQRALAAGGRSACRGRSHRRLRPESPAAAADPTPPARAPAPPTA